MKRYLTILMIALFSFNFAMAEEEKSGAKTVFEKQMHDFGVIKEEKGPVTCEFKFTNEGTEPLIIISARASCGCTRPEFPRKPIAPGKSGGIKVTYNPKNRPGGFSKMVRVKTTDANISLILEGSVIPKEKK